MSARCCVKSSTSPSVASTAPRHYLFGLLACLVFGAAAPALADSYPSKPIRLIVGFGTGSGNDLIARELAIHMGQGLGQSVVVENRVGAGGSVGTEVVAKAAPDGYTIGLGTSSQLVMNPALYKSLPFDVDKDLRSIGLISRTPLVLAGSGTTPRTLKELVAAARANPDRLTYGSGGTGSISHIVGEAFKKAANVALLHVPYKGNGAAMIDLSGGHVNLVFDGLLSAGQLAQQGRAHLIAISGEKRSELAPQVPTFAEQGLPTYQAYTWNSLFVSAKTPVDIIDKLNLALNNALTNPSVQDRLRKGASESLGPSTPAQADVYAQKERAQWVPLVRALNIEAP